VSVSVGQDGNSKALGEGLAQKAFADGLASLFQVAPAFHDVTRARPVS
jgi:hypothetical protein